MKILLFFFFSLLLWTSLQIADVGRTDDKCFAASHLGGRDTKVKKLEIQEFVVDVLPGNGLQEQVRTDSNHPFIPPLRVSKRSTNSRDSGERLDRRKSTSRRNRHRHRSDISLWIDENQVRIFSGYSMEIYAIVNGRIMPYILHPDFEKQLPVIPSEVEYVNFTWKSPRKRYFYHFDLLTSFDKDILKDPFVSIRRKGRVPRRPKVFSVRIPCVGNKSGIATFGIGLRIDDRERDPLPDTPMRLKLRKKCDIAAGPDGECNKKCANGGVCDEEGRCQCQMGYMGQFCNVALCYPQCLNGGSCSSPGRCSCPPGYHGRICEGGICRSKCLNGGKCIQKDTCKCRKGFYGNRCEFSTYIASA